MAEKVEQNMVKSIQWKFKLIKLLAINVEEYLLPFFQIELVLDILFYIQIFKFSVDYFSNSWFGANTAIFLYLDLSYYVSFSSSSAFFSFAIIGVMLINLYWMAPLTIYLLQYQRSNIINNILRVLHLIFKNIFLLPMTNMILNLFNCYTDGTIIGRKCFQHYSISFVIMVIFSFLIFFSFIMGQVYFDFQFIKRQKHLTRIRRSGITNSIILIYAVVSQLSNYLFSTTLELAMLNLATITLLTITILNKDEVSQKVRVIQYAFFSVQLLATLFLNLSNLLNPSLPMFLFPLLAPLLFVGVLQLKTTSLTFQLDNINKWPTPQIMISYARKLRDYLALCDDYKYIVYIHGYMQIHRQKCDNPQCPSRRKLSQFQLKLFESGQLDGERQQLLRCQNIIKKIYSDGYKLTPISPQLQLQNSIFLYEKKQTELSLRNLLAIKLDRLSLDKIFQFSFLKQKIHKELNLQSNKCLDLVSELIVKKEQQAIFQKFEKAALLNLQFWSILNDDHPDFQKINQVALSRIHIRDQIRQNYTRICSIAHSQRVTAFYANYLDTIENDEHMFNQIYNSIKRQFDLQNKITLQDWANSSSNIMLVSIDQLNFGKIVDINTSCASIVGYQKFQLMNQSLKNLFVDDLKNQLKAFTDQVTNQSQFYITHKSGYLIKIIKYSQNYNSMKTGMTAIIRLQVSLNPGICSFLLNKNSKVIGATASIIPLIGVDLKLFQSQVVTTNFFIPKLEDFQQMAKDKQISYPLQKIIRGEYFEDELVSPRIKNQPLLKNGLKGKKQFRIYYKQYLKHITIQLHEVIKHGRSSLSYSRTNIFPDFQFKVNANAQGFKFYGASKNQQQNLSQFNKANQNQIYSQNKPEIGYQMGITTLRLRNNVIQIIESQQEIDIDQQNLLNKQMNNELLVLPRKDQEEIFQNKQSFQQFIQKYKIANYAFILIGVGILGVIGLLIGYYALYSYHNNSIMQNSFQIAYQHLINGAITKQSTLIKALQLAAKNRSQFNGQLFLNTYLDNMNYLQNIELIGSQAFPIQIQMLQSVSSMLSREYLITIVNYAYKFTSLLKNTTSTNDMWNIFSSLDPYIQYFLTTGSFIAKQQMYSYIMSQQYVIINNLKGYLKIEGIMLALAIVYIFIYMVFIYIIINKTNGERIDIFEIFLQISDIKIQQYSNKSERLLVSLHIEQANDIEEDPDKKVNSAMFSKKKSFKEISFSKSIYLQIMVIPLFFIGYFIHIYVFSSANLTFQLASLPQFRLSAFADYQLYSNLNSIQKAVLNLDGSLEGFTIGTQLRQYYKSYLQVHYNAFGYVSTFHNAWINVFYKDICPGIMTPLGNTTIIQSCQIPSLTNNGTYVIISNLIDLVQMQDFNIPIDLDYMHKFETISKTHRLITTFLINSQKDFTSNFESSLVQILLIWLFCGFGIIVVWGIPVTRKFIMEINEVKNIISILPISLARQLPNARKYFHKILKEQSC